MAYIVVRDAFDVAESQGKHRLRVLQRLALALLVDAQHENVLGRAHVQPDDIAQLLDEERVGRELEVLAPVRLQAKQLEVAMHARLGDAGLAGHRANAPMRRAVSRPGMQCRLDRLCQTLVVDRAGLADARFAVEPVDASLDELRTPLAHGARIESRRAAIAVFGSPCSLAKTIFARLLRADGKERLRAKLISWARSSSLIVEDAFGLPLVIAVAPLGNIPQTMQEMC